MANVLLAEDDGDVAAALAVALEEQGHRVRRAADGIRAADLARREEIDLAILDLLLPGKSGVDVATEIRAVAESVPIILISGIYRGEAERTRALRETRAVAFLEKPFEAAELVAAVESALERALPAERTEVDSPAGPAGAASYPDLERATVPMPEPLADDLAIRERREVERLAARPAKAGRWQGTLTETAFARVFWEIFEARGTGGLLVVREPVKKVVFFADGSPVFVKSNLLSECLGKVMVKAGLITEEQCRASLRRLQKQKRPQGEILVEMGVLDAAGVERGLLLQIETKLLDLFGWPAGKYRFSAQMKAPSGAQSRFDHPLSVLVEGARRRMDLARIRREIDRSLDRKASLRPTASESLAGLALSGDEKALVASLDGRGSLREKIAEGQNAEARTRLVYALLVAGLVELGQKVRSGSTGRALAPFDVEPTPPPRSAPPAPTAAPTRPRATAPAPGSLSALDAEVERVLDAERCFQKGVEMMRVGRLAPAVESFERAVTLCPDAAEFRLELGTALLDASRRDASLLPRAVAELREVTTQRPDLAIAWRRLGDALGRSGRRDDAIGAYERSLEIEPGSKEARAALAVLGAR